MTYRIRITPEIRQVNPEVEYVDLPEGWAGWSVQQRSGYLEDLGTETIESLAGAGVCVVDENDDEVGNLADT